MTCRWCTEGTCLLCQLGDSIKADSGISSLMGRLSDFEHRVPGDMEVYTPMTSALPCPLCGAPYKDLMLHYRNAHPGVRWEIRR